MRATSVSLISERIDEAGVTSGDADELCSSDGGGGGGGGGGKLGGGPIISGGGREIDAAAVSGNGLAPDRGDVTGGRRVCPIWKADED